MYNLHAAHSASGRNLVSRIFAAIFEIKIFFLTKVRKGTRNVTNITLCLEMRHNEPTYICRIGVERFRKREAYLEKRRSGQ
jgi:hypothetical protein